ncbi:hypothetical protein BdWA1_002714 [Babesia duncani]|uniref:Uncharacterized protein n=1 Tax=Babesia duncani TaxID=323732 RepID=A0AAD9PK02_9APIC|nr:hypothetical protein BdWA1_002714 [Babesia duncani]
MTGLYVGETTAVINFCVFWGTALGLYVTSLVISLENCKKDIKWLGYVTPGLSIVTRLSMFLINARILYIFCCYEGANGILSMYVWFAMNGIAYSFDIVVTMKTSPERAADWAMGENMGNIFVSVLHGIINACNKFLKFCHNNEDQNLFLLFWHIVIVLIISFVTLVSWIAHLVVNVFMGSNGSTNKASNSGKSFWQCLMQGISPSIMLIVGAAFEFLLFPSISPYLVVHQSMEYKTSLMLLIVSSIGPILSWILCEDNVNKYTHFNTHWEGYAIYYHCFWLLAIPMLIVYVAFLWCLHYPGSFCDRHIRYKNPAILMACIYHFCVYTFTGLGSGAAYPNLSGSKLSGTEVEATDETNGSHAFSFVSAITMMSMVITNLGLQCYSTIYLSYVDGLKSGFSWPTEGLSGFRSYCWWLNMSLKGAFNRFRNISKTDIVKVIS